MRLFSEFMGMLTNKPEYAYDPQTKIKMPNGMMARMGRVNIKDVVFKCVVCEKTYPGGTDGGYVTNHQDVPWGNDKWICPDCVSPDQAKKSKALRAGIKEEVRREKEIAKAVGSPGFKTLVLDLLDKAHYFMISPEAVFTQAGGARPELDLYVAPPFETCWFQFPEPNAGFTGFKTSGDEVVYGMFLHEVSPQRYMFALVIKNDDPNAPLRLRGGFASENDNHDIWHSIAFWLQPFTNGAKIGIEKVNERFKYKTNDEKKLLKIKKVVYVYPKKMTATLREDAEQRHIDFTHRFEVRAHWRDLGPGRIGKNRAGEYCVAGKTFVMEGIKGPKHLPLIKKTRIVLDANKH